MEALSSMSPAEKAAALAAMTPEQRAAALALMSPEERARVEGKMAELAEAAHQADIAPTAEQYAALEAENAKNLRVIARLEKALNDAHFDVREKSNAISKLVHFEAEVATMKQQLSEAMSEIETLNVTGRKRVATQDKGVGMGAAEYPPPPGPPGSQPEIGTMSEDGVDPRQAARERHAKTQEMLKSGSLSTVATPEDLNSPKSQTDGGHVLLLLVLPSNS